MRARDLPQKVAGVRDNVMNGRNDPSPWGAIWAATGGVVIGAIAALLLDPQRGKARRARLADQSLAVARKGARVVERQVRRAGSEIGGKAQAVRHLGDEGDEDLNDAALAAKVQTELFADPSIPKGSINVNVEQGTVVLRGEVSDEATSRMLESAAGRIPGVRGVENLLHLPGEPASVAR